MAARRSCGALLDPSKLISTHSPSQVIQLACLAVAANISCCLLLLCGTCNAQPFCASMAWQNMDAVQAMHFAKWQPVMCCVAMCCTPHSASCIARLLDVARHMSCGNAASLLSTWFRSRVVTDAWQCCCLVTWRIPCSSFELYAGAVHCTSAGTCLLIAVLAL